MAKQLDVCKSELKKLKGKLSQYHRDDHDVDRDEELLTLKAQNEQLKLLRMKHEIDRDEEVKNLRSQNQALIREVSFFLRKV